MHLDVVIGYGNLSHQFVVSSLLVYTVCMSSLLSHFGGVLYIHAY